jgi:YihY family inner membrane protein
LLRSPGSASLAFTAYLVRFGNYTAVYGAIGGAIVSMLWFYVSGLAILIGAELSAVIEEAGARSASRCATGLPRPRP